MHAASARDFSFPGCGRWWWDLPLDVGFGGRGGWDSVALYHHPPPLRTLPKPTTLTTRAPPLPGGGARRPPFFWLAAAQSLGRVPHAASELECVVACSTVMQCMDVDSTYIYIHMYIYIYIYIDTDVCIHIHIYIYTSTSLDSSTYINISM